MRRVILDEPVGQFTCPECGHVTVVYGDDSLMPQEGHKCVRCLDPRQEAHDEFLEAERQLAEAS
jgi:transcription elongation factor Elf1